jgi:hypothetical protein
MAGSRQLVEKPPRLFQISGVEALGEPCIYRREKILGFGPPSPFGPQPSEASCGTQLVGLGLLLPRDAQRFLKSDAGTQGCAEWSMR